jgi:hypothetical protein
MKKVLFYPDPPIQLPKHSLSKTIIYFQIAGYDLTNDIDSDWDIAVHWTRMDDYIDRWINRLKQHPAKIIHFKGRKWQDKAIVEKILSL